MERTPEYRSYFDRPPETDWNIISLGGGVQSSVMALMAAEDEIGPRPQAAVFADTQGEPQAVYEWLDWLAEHLPFPIHRISKGSLAEGEMVLRRAKTSGRLYSKMRIPAFAKKPDGSRGILGRKCTLDFKIEPIQQHLRKLCNIKRGQKTCTVTQWIGISADEMGRAKAARHPWYQMRYPLLELNMNREDCLAWMRRRGWPEPPRSACLFCPFHSDHEWQRIKDGDPREWAYVQQFEKDLQAVAAQSEVLDSTPFLHPSLTLIGEVDFKPKAKGDRQLTLHEMWNDIKNECEGMCGV